MNCIFFFLKKGYQKKKKRSRSPTQFIFLSQDYVLPCLLIPTSSTFYEKKRSNIQAILHSSICSPLAAPSPSCINTPGSAKHWNGCMTDGMSGSLHVSENSRQKYTSWLTAFCALGVYLLWTFWSLGVFGGFFIF